MNIYISYKTFSDHNFVCINIDFSNIERGQGIWIFNNKLLQDENATFAVNTNHDITNIQMLEEELNIIIYCQATGAKVNIDRSKVICIGNANNNMHLLILQYL